MNSEIRSQLEAAARLHLALADEAAAPLSQAVDLILASYAKGGKVLFCGNGGSAADAQHWAAELVGRYLRNRKGYAAIALTTDSSILTAVGNDFGYDEVFRRQVEALGRPEDCLVGISTSGGSVNVVLAMEEARRIGMSTIAFVGAQPGAVSALANVTLFVPSAETPRIQEAHATLGHILCDRVELALSSTNSQGV